jgi:DNA-directed RNA polymerase subunit H (RpoH/RPB5)
MASQNNSSLISQIYKSRITLLDYMRRQDYDVKDYEGFSVNDINTMKTNNQLDMILEKTESLKTNDNNKTYIKYHLEKVLRPPVLQEFIDDLFTVEEVLNKTCTLFVVVKSKVNDTLIEFVKHIWESDGIFVILVPLERLQYNVLDHVLVPPHKVLPEEQKIAIKDRYNIKNDYEFPELSRFDPVAQAIGIRPGQVCEILRPSKTAVTAPYYRICM